MLNPSSLATDKMSAFHKASYSAIQCDNNQSKVMDYKNVDS